MATKTKKAVSKKLAMCIAKAAGDKKGVGIVVLDIRKVSDIADYFVLATGTSDRHVRAMAEGILERSKQDMDQRAFHRVGVRDGNWVVLDYVDVVVHLFTEHSRRYYNLDRLWGDGKVVKQPA